MKKTFLMMTALVLVLGMTQISVAQAQGYDGVLADDSSDTVSINSDEDVNPTLELYNQPYRPDWGAVEAARRNAAFGSTLETLSADREAAATARAAEAEQIQADIDARVDAAVNATSDYDTRVDALKAPPTQLPPEQQPVVVTPETQPGTGGTTTGGDTGGTIGDNPRVDRDGSVLDRMMNALQ